MITINCHRFVNSKICISLIVPYHTLNAKILLIKTKVSYIFGDFPHSFDIETTKTKIAMQPQIGFTALAHYLKITKMEKVD